MVDLKTQLNSLTNLNSIKFYIVFVPLIFVGDTISAAVLKYPDKSNLEEKGARLNSQLQVRSTIVGMSKAGTSNG